MAKDQPSNDDDYSGLKSQSYQGSEPDIIKQGIVEELYNTTKRVTELISAWAGKAGRGIQRRALGGARFLFKTEGAFKSVIATNNAFSKKGDLECQKILYEANRAFIYDMVNDDTVDERDYRTMAKSFEHSMELFLGLVEAGHGAIVLRDSLAGLNTPQVEDKKRSPLMELIRR